MQTTSTVLMIRPVDFGFNAETAVNNAFQVQSADDNIQEKALAEFDGFVNLLITNGVDVTVINDSLHPHTPDSIFPNNWISFHINGTICLYPMYASNRRPERKPDIIQALHDRFMIKQKIDLTHYEKDNRFLEGTGSMVLDRENKKAYACLSQRTDILVLQDFCAKMDYSPVTFQAFDTGGQPIYHTNVMMCIADQYAVVCLSSLQKKAEREQLQDVIADSGKEVIDISVDQMNHFAGNMLQLQNLAGEPLLVMSTQAFQSLSREQHSKLQSYNKIRHAPLSNIETSGGGSARCMIAEIFLPQKK